MAAPDAAPVPDPALAPSLRAAFDAAGYDEDGVLARFSCGELLRVEARELPHLRALTASGSALDTIVRLFLLGIAVDEDAARRAAAPAALEAWIAGGLLARDGNEVVARLRIVPQLGFRIAFDGPVRGTGREAAADYVPGLGPASSYLLNATVRRPVERALDLGTGCGGQGLALSRHARHVIATDVNPRALAVARFNAALNGVANLELRSGPLFAPVAGERFDLVTMNPPFAISPDARFVFRDGSRAGNGAGDAFVERVVREAPAYLRPGGLLQITAQWAHVAGEDWRLRLARWTEGSGCDAWVIRLYTQSAETYAANWISETEEHDAASFDARWRTWRDALRGAGIEDVSTGLISLRRRDAPGAERFWVSDDVTALDEGTGAAIARGFAARSVLEASDDAHLLALAFRVSPDAVLEQHATSAGAGWSAAGATLALTRGLPVRFAIDPRVAQLVGRCDGLRPLGQAVTELAAGLGAPVEALLPSLLPIVRGLVERGVLVVPGGAPPGQAGP